MFGDDCKHFAAYQARQKQMTISKSSDAREFDNQPAHDHPPVPVFRNQTMKRPRHSRSATLLLQHQGYPRAPHHPL